ncbi:MAG: stage II sporulation protein R [Clostridiales bacterium]|nr:stage II sporulation protein R [Clostridiales bacterium]
MKLKKWELSLIAAIIITLFVTTGVSKSQSELSEKLVRLHVVANSDSDEDQTLKLRVRDRVLNSLAEPLDGISDAGEAQAVIRENFGAIEGAALEEIRLSGCDYSVSVSLGTEDFPTREYDTFSLPAGEYTALRVEIGGGAGQNWWCVVFPPLCTEIATSGDIQALALLGDEEIKLIVQEEGYVVRFKCMEVLASIKAFFNR